MKLDIKKTTDQILRKPTKEVSSFDMELQKLIDNMIDTMRAANGVGLAAPQIGQDLKLLVCEFTPDKDTQIDGFPLTVVCNPKIVDKSTKEIEMVEGCLSFPGLEIIVNRPEKVTVEGQDRYGNNIEIKADKLFARVLQHEIDHLNSTLLIDHIREVNTVFIGTGTLGVPALEMLATDPQYNIKYVITGDTKPAISRKSHEILNPVEELAKKYRLPLLKVKNINDETIVNKIKAAKPVVGIMADFGQIIKKEILDIPKFGIINIHPSILPRHRGPSPIQETILQGDKLTGVSLILTSEKMDAGHIISQICAEMTGSETSTILKNYLAEIGGTLLLNSLPYYLTGDLIPHAQDESKVTYTRLFKKEDGLVDENSDSKEVERKIRAFDVWPKVFIIKNGKRIQITAAHFDQENHLVIDRIKPEGKKEMFYSEFIRGSKIRLTFKS